MFRPVRMRWFLKALQSSFPRFSASWGFPFWVWNQFVENLFSSIRYHGFSSSTKCHVYHHVGGRRHTPVVCNERREPHTSHYPSRPVTKNNNQQITHTSHYRSRPLECFWKLQLYRGFFFKKVYVITFSNASLSLTVPRTQSALPIWRAIKICKSAASKTCQLVDRRANDRACYRDAWWKFHCFRLKNPVLPRPPVKNCIRCLLIRDTSQFYALQPRWRWFPVYIKSLDSGDWMQEHPQLWHPTPAVYSFPKELW